MIRKYFNALLAVFFMLSVLGCKKESEVQPPEDSWTVKDDIITYKLEYDSEKRLKKESRYVNESLYTYQTYKYLEDLVTKRHYNHRSELRRSYHYILDENDRVVRYDIKDAEGIVNEKKHLSTLNQGFLLNIPLIVVRQHLLFWNLVMMAIISRNIL